MANEKTATGRAREDLKDGNQELVRAKWKKQVQGRKEKM